MKMLVVNISSNYFQVSIRYREVYKLEVEKKIPAVKVAKPQDEL